MQMHREDGDRLLLFWETCSGVAHWYNLGNLEELQNSADRLMGILSGLGLSVRLRRGFELEKQQQKELPLSPSRR